MHVFTAAVVGAGARGGEIAQAIAAAGVPVVLKDVDEQALGAAVQRARSIWQGRVDAGRLDAAEAERQAGLITPTTSDEALGDVDFVIEALPEQIELKQAVLSELDAATPGHAILATTTTTLSVTELGEATSRPERVVGFHVLQPASTARLVEVVESDDTAPETAQAAAAFAQRIRKLPIRCGEAPGYVVGRILEASAAEPPGETGGDGELAALRALVESCLVLEEGVASLKDIDLAMMAGGGLAPPPFARADQAGLDRVLAALVRAAGEGGEAFEPPAILRRLVAQGRLGAGSGQGFFPYPRPDAGWAQSPVKLETRGAVAIAWLDRPPANSISPEVVQTLQRLWDEVTGAGGVRALVFASANPMLFCAGADIKAFTTMDEAAGRDLLERMHGLLRAMERSRVVTIAAVNAVAFGGGCELAMACDLRIAAESASFGQPEINLGIIPGFGGTQRLPRLIGEARALQMNLTGDPIDAAEAYELGLANEVVPDHELLDTALAWARRLAEQAPLAVEQIKRLSAAGDLDAGIEAEKQGFATVFGSADAREGIGAFLQKRQPRFEGR